MRKLRNLYILHPTSLQHTANVSWWRTTPTRPLRPTHAYSPNSFLTRFRTESLLGSALQATAHRQRSAVTADSGHALSAGRERAMGVTDHTGDPCSEFRAGREKPSRTSRLAGGSGRRPVWRQVTGECGPSGGGMGRACDGVFEEWGASGGPSGPRL